jgi:molybdopterin synthase sulfur carrier subunit
MAQVTVTYRGKLAEETGKRSEEIEAQTVRQVLRQVKTNYGKEAHRIAKMELIAVNGVGILQKRVFATTLSDGDVVSFYPLAAGG